MSQQERFLFNLVDGTPVYHGDTLYPHPRYIRYVGAVVTAQFKPDGSEVTVRSENGAVPHVPINMLFKTPHPDSETYVNLEKALQANGWSNLNDRDLAVYRAGLKFNETKLSELITQVEAAKSLLNELREKSEALHFRWHSLSDTVALAEAEILDECIDQLDQIFNPVLTSQEGH